MIIIIWLYRIEGMFIVVIKEILHIPFDFLLVQYVQYCARNGLCTVVRKLILDQDDDEHDYELDLI